jgi:hypothetical protein
MSTLAVPPAPPATSARWHTLTACAARPTTRWPNSSAYRRAPCRRARVRTWQTPAETAETPVVRTEQWCGVCRPTFTNRGSASWLSLVTPQPATRVSPTRVSRRAKTSGAGPSGRAPALIGAAPAEIAGIGFREAGHCEAGRLGVERELGRRLATGQAALGGAERCLVRLPKGHGPCVLPQPCATPRVASGIQRRDLE